MMHVGQPLAANVEDSWMALNPIQILNYCDKFRYQIKFEGVFKNLIRN